MTSGEAVSECQECASHGKQGNDYTTKYNTGDNFSLEIGYGGEFKLCSENQKRKGSCHCGKIIKHLPKRAYGFQNRGVAVGCYINAMLGKGKFDSKTYKSCNDTDNKRVFCNT